MSARTDLAEQLRAALPDIPVTDHPDLPGQIRDLRIVLWATDVRRIEHASSRLTIATDVEVWLIWHGDLTRKGEARLDDGLVELLDVINGMSAYTWSTAERSTLADTFHGWRIPVTAVYTTPLTTT